MYMSIKQVLTWISLVWMQPIATMFAGHLGKVELNVVALANTVGDTLDTCIYKQNHDWHIYQPFHIQ